jgi:hypothetical protein
MAELKTKPNKKSVQKFLKNPENKKYAEDAQVVLKMMENITGEKPAMWGGTIVGFGSYHYKYPSGQEGDWFLTGFSPRKANLTIYIMAGFEKSQPLLKKLGKHKTSKSCLYIKKLDDIDLKVLSKLIKESFVHMKKMDTN